MVVEEQVYVLTCWDLLDTVVLQFKEDDSKLCQKSECQIIYLTARRQRNVLFSNIFSSSGAKATLVREFVDETTIHPAVQINVLLIKFIFTTDNPIGVEPKV